jgi:glycosyltransferase involved in cell wall biosynthesis
MCDNPPSLSICICTSGRPEVLRRCLASIAAGSRLPDDVIVSDDSPTKEQRDEVRRVVAAFSFARYTQGPAKGLCANRNHVIVAATTSHISLLDDDAVVGHEFVESAVRAIASEPAAVFSGDVLEDGVTHTPPSNPTAWGHFGAFPAAGTPLRNVQLNSNVFPRRAFADAAFDERLVYGYEDTDLCDRLVRVGWRIERRPELLNTHLPPLPRGDRGWLAERERFAVLLRLRSGRLGPLPAIVFWGPAATAHAAVAYTLRGEWGWLLRLPTWVFRGAFLSLVGPCPSGLPVCEASPSIRRGVT